MRKLLALVCLVIMMWSCLGNIVTSRVAASETAQLPQLIRLHVLANSEELVDQRIKLAVRDELLVVLNSLLAKVTSMAEAEIVIKANLGVLAEAAELALAQAEATYTARLQFGEFNFPAKYYGPATLPAGRYTALNVTLGEGEGRNWWCIVFPAMCFTAGVCEAVAEEPELPPTYHLRSKIVEWLERFVAWCTS